MPKTSNLRSELLDIQQAADKSFIVTVSVWESPGDRDSPHANVFAFVSHRNPALWWRLSLYSAMNTGTDRTAKYTNAQYNRALRTATDAMNALITQESDAREAKRAPKPVTPNTSLPSLTYGTMPDEVSFLMSVANRFESPFRFNMRLNTRDYVTVRRAAELSGSRTWVHLPLLVEEGETLTLTNPRDMYRLIQSLWLMQEEFDDTRAGDLASAILGMAGFNWV